MPDMNRPAHKIVAVENGSRSSLIAVVDGKVMAFSAATCAGGKGARNDGCRRSFVEKQTWEGPFGMSIFMRETSVAVGPREQSG